MFERSEFLPLLKAVIHGGNLPLAGKEFGYPFLLTLLWYAKRVRRRAGAQPRDLDLVNMLPAEKFYRSIIQIQTPECRQDIILT